jgi:hypothetical protein
VFGAIGISASYLSWVESIWTAPVSLVSFFLGQLLVKGGRFDTTHLISPKNMALFLLFGALVISPISALYSGLIRGKLPVMPGPVELNIAVIIYNASYWALLGGFAIAERHAPRSWPAAPVICSEKRQKLLLLGACLCGFFGIYLRFGSIGGMLAFYSETSNLSTIHKDLSLTQTVGQLLRPCAYFGMLALWANWVSLTGRERARVRTVVLSAIWLLAVIVANLSFNRGSLVLAVFGMVAIYSAIVRHVRWWVLLAGGTVLWAALVILGEVRASQAAATEAYASISIKDELLIENKFVYQAQIYLSGPQFLGFVVREIGLTGPYRLGGTFVASLVAPIPFFGAPVREHTGMSIFNDLVYGRSSLVVDQIFPSQGEVLLNFGVFGILPFYFAIGVGVAFIHCRFVAAVRFRMGAVALAWLFIGYWFSMSVIGCVAVVSQFFIYNAPPLIAFLVINRCSSKNVKSLTVQ